MREPTEVTDKKAEARDTDVAVDPRQAAQIERAKNGEGTLEGAGGWAALATQRSTRHVVDPSAPAPAVDTMKTMLVDPNDGTEHPTLLEDQLASNEGMKRESEKILAQDTSGSRAENPAGNMNAADYEAKEYQYDDSKSAEENATAKEAFDNAEKERIAALPERTTDTDTNDDAEEEDAATKAETPKPKPVAKAKPTAEKKSGGIKSRTKTATKTE